MYNYTMKEALGEQTVQFLAANFENNVKLIEQAGSTSVGMDRISMRMNDKSILYRIDLAAGKLEELVLTLRAVLLAAKNSGAVFENSTFEITTENEREKKKITTILEGYGADLEAAYIFDRDRKGDSDGNSLYKVVFSIVFN